MYKFKNAVLTSLIQRICLLAHQIIFFFLLQQSAIFSKSCIFNDSIVKSNSLIKEHFQVFLDYRILSQLSLSARNIGAIFQLFAFYLSGTKVSLLFKFIKSVKMLVIQGGDMSLAAHGTVRSIPRTKVSYYSLYYTKLTCIILPHP